MVTVWDPVTLRASTRCTLRFVRSETSGPTFDRMAARIEAIASHTGMAGVFRLLAADVFEVLAIDACHRPPGAAEPAPTRRPIAPATPAGAARQARRALGAPPDLSSAHERGARPGRLLAAVLDSLAEDFGFEHAKVLLVDETGRRLFTVASRGYERERRRRRGRVRRGPDRHGGARSPHPAGRAAWTATCATGARCAPRCGQAAGATLRPEIPLPGLADAQSHLALPLLVRGRLVGVLALESRSAATLRELARGVPGHRRRSGGGGHRAAGRGATTKTPSLARSAPPRAAAPAAARKKRSFVFYQNDDCVFVDGEYLIRNVPGRILWKLLKRPRARGAPSSRTASCGWIRRWACPALRDNLESRLILLRQRLEQKCPDVRLPSRGRGRFAVEIDCDLDLVERASA